MGTVTRGMLIFCNFLSFCGQAPAPATCRFTHLHNPNARKDVNATYKNDSLIECTTPNVTTFFTDDEMVVETVLEVSLNGDQFTKLNQIIYTFYREPTIVAANQGSGKKDLIVNGGDPVLSISIVPSFAKHLFSI